MGRDCLFALGRQSSVSATIKGAKRPSAVLSPLCRCRRTRGAGTFFFFSSRTKVGLYIQTCLRRHVAAATANQCHLDSSHCRSLNDERTCKIKKKKRCLVGVTRHKKALRSRFSLWPRPSELEELDLASPVNVS